MTAAMTNGWRRTSCAPSALCPRRRKEWSSACAISISISGKVRCPPFCGGKGRAWLWTSPAAAWLSSFISFPCLCLALVTLDLRWREAQGRLRPCDRSPLRCRVLHWHLGERVHHRLHEVRGGGWTEMDVCLVSVVRYLLYICIVTYNVWLVVCLLYNQICRVA